MPCTNCNRDITIAARGLCRACYSRWQKRGTTDYLPKRERTFCQIDGCGRPVVSHGLCDMHRLRLRDHGKLESNRPDSWGAKHNHPLYNAWAWMRRHKSQHPVASEWDDFLQFTIDVGERPSTKHKLFAANDASPIGPENFLWKEAITQKVEGEDDRTYFNRAQKVYRSVRREAFQGYGLKKNYGLSKADYDVMSERQDHKCAICQEPEGAVIRGKTLSLAVDHDHATGKIRGLLCADCNRAIGMLKDSPELLEKAAGYIRTNK